MTPLDPISYLHQLDPTSRTRLIPDERALCSLLETLLERSGLTLAQIADRMGVKRQTISQYVKGKRINPPLMWFLRFAAICGADVEVKNL